MNPGSLYRRLAPVLRRKRGVGVLQVLDLAVDLVGEHRRPPAEIGVEDAGLSAHGHLGLRRRDPVDQAQSARLGLPHRLAPRRRGHDDGAGPPHAPLVRPGVKPLDERSAEPRGLGVDFGAMIPGAVAGPGRDREQRVDDGERTVGRQEPGAVLGCALQRGHAQPIELDDVGAGQLVAMPDEWAGPERPTAVARPERARGRPIGRTPPRSASEAGGVPAHDEVNRRRLVERAPTVEERGGLEGDDAVEPFSADDAQEDFADGAVGGEVGCVGAGRYVGAAAHSSDLAGGQAALDLARIALILGNSRGGTRLRAHVPTVPDDAAIRQVAAGACG